ncbi:conserved hypothetical protein [Clostridium neonatale]|uniref:Uncharacterized protein n=1 Tax=Clostridium carnis TaxID=1530 RepID=A0ABY6SRQ0_9CLOT|nr:hypothetical protein [Clostridium carnis]CAI3546909.1 conserved hypothetical protein [Clostridium neonatale]CAI3548904.1 conserved hypothetical protein [Clostridium neonatale]CAI3601606.1 conserved hypothetical protein [Clostridium neonatale]CAI3603261.1 conserved hypothetical protein [Clostridium neonatale]CAI3604762.1 conserved hypothetical protein [Clostridium neonatale]
MYNKKIFEVYLKQEGEECEISATVNTNIEVDGLITEEELEKIKNITLNICKRINLKNGDDEFKLPSVFK